jgi:RNA recognition motif-containing protein
MAQKLYVGNLSHDITDSELQGIFEPFGSVLSAQVIVDRETRRSKGFGFVEMSSEEEAKAAIDNLNSKEAYGRPLTVNVARPRENRSGAGYRGGNRSHSTADSGRRY